MNEPLTTDEKLPIEPPASNQRVCVDCGMSWQGIHRCVPDLKAEIERLNAIIEGCKVEADLSDGEVERLVKELEECRAGQK